VEPSILKSTKKMVGVAEDDTFFDLDIVTHINAAFSVLNQLGVGPVDAFTIEDATAEWSQFVVPTNQLSMVKSYIYLKTRQLYDPPTLSFLIDAMDKQLNEMESRLNLFREELQPDPFPERSVEEGVVWAD
jgi:hypothetical protein